MTQASSSAINALPAEFINRLRLIVPERWREAVFASFVQPRVTSFRVNTLAISVEQAVAELESADVPFHRVAWCDHALFVEPQYRSRLTHCQLASNGGIYIQGLSSIVASLVLDPQPGQDVLDLAAAPGGKALHIAALMQNKGRLSVIEPVRQRMFVLANNLKLAGVTISRTYRMDGRRAGQKVPDRFDRAIIDAPCSGESRFHVDQPQTWEYWSLRKIREQSRKQQGLIRSAYQSLKRGGRMLYSTCSFAPEENELIVDRFLNDAGDSARLLPVELPFDNWQAGLCSFGDQQFSNDLSRARRILPNEHHDGFFMALIEKR